MSQTIAQRHRTSVHVPLTPILAVLATAIVAAAALVLINQPTTTSTSIETQAGVATAAQAAAVPMPESPARPDPAHAVSPSDGDLSRSGHPARDRVRRAARLNRSTAPAKVSGRENRKGPVSPCRSLSPMAPPWNSPTARP